MHACVCVVHMSMCVVHVFCICAYVYYAHVHCVVHCVMHMCMCVLCTCALCCTCVLCTCACVYVMHMCSTHVHVCMLCTCVETRGPPLVLVSTILPYTEPRAQRLTRRAWRWEPRSLRPQRGKHRLEAAPSIFHECQGL